MPEEEEHPQPSEEECEDARCRVREDEVDAIYKEELGAEPETVGERRR